MNFRVLQENTTWRSQRPDEYARKLSIPYNIIISCVVVQPLCLSPSHNKPPGLAKIVSEGQFFRPLRSGSRKKRVFYDSLIEIVFIGLEFSPRLGTFENKSATSRRLFRNWRIDCDQGVVKYHIQYIVFDDSLTVTVHMWRLLRCYALSCTVVLKFKKLFRTMCSVQNTHGEGMQDFACCIALSCSLCFFIQLLVQRLPLVYTSPRSCVFVLYEIHNDSLCLESFPASERFVCCTCRASISSNRKLSVSEVEE